MTPAKQAAEAAPTETVVQELVRLVSHYQDLNCPLSEQEEAWNLIADSVVNRIGEIDAIAATADLARENAQLLADLEHMAQQAGDGSCAAIAVENQRLRKEVERLTKERDEADSAYNDVVEDYRKIVWQLPYGKAIFEDKYPSI